MDSRLQPALDLIGGGNGGGGGNDGIGGDEGGDFLGYFGALVFLQKVAGAADGFVGLVGGAGYMLLENSLAAACDRVPAAEQGQKGFVPLLEH